MIRVQHLSVTGDSTRLRAEAERILSNHRKFKSSSWRSEDVLIANFGLSILAWKQTITVAVVESNAQASELWVGGQVPALIDYGINKRNLRWFSDALADAGFGVIEGPVEDSWPQLLHRSESHATRG